MVGWLDGWMLSTDKNVIRIPTIGNQDKFCEITTIQKLHKLSTNIIIQGRNKYFLHKLKEEGCLED